MNMKKMIGWLAIAATAVLLMVLKRSHLGVLHYNWFMIILMAWCLVLVVFFRMHKKPDRIG